MNEGFHVDIDELRSTSADIGRIVEGINETPFDQVDNNPGKYGNEDVQQAVSEFCQGLRIAIPAMTGLAHSTGSALRETADHYVEIDNHIENNLNPHSGHQ